ncbi:MAG: response regulator [Anaerolinea sp.]|nr:response regulator [Anaerolinea sp.]
MTMKIPRAFIGWDVLVVDDERDSLEVAARMLKIAGATVTTADNGKAGLEKAQTQQPPFKFILCDLSMPEMDGWELLYLLRQNQGTTTVPVIALTAHAMTGDRERGIAAGFQNYITKPLDPLKFIPQLISHLSEIPEYKALLTHPI